MNHEVTVWYEFGIGFLPFIVTYFEDVEDKNNNFIKKVTLENSEEDLFEFLNCKCPFVLEDLLELAEQKMNSKDARIEGLLDDRKNREEL